MKEIAFGLIPLVIDSKPPLVLLVQQESGVWSFPKGRVDDADTDGITTARREFEEETGIQEYTVDTQHSFHEAYQKLHEGQHIDKEVVYFLAHLHKQALTLQEGEIRSHCWVELPEARRLLKHTSRQQIVDAVEVTLHTL